MIRSKMTIINISKKIDYCYGCKYIATKAKNMEKVIKSEQYEFVSANTRSMYTSAHAAITQL